MDFPGSNFGCHTGTLWICGYDWPCDGDVSGGCRNRIRSSVWCGLQTDGNQGQNQPKISRDVGTALAVFWLLIGAYIWRTIHTVKIISDTSNREQILAFVCNRHAFAEGDRQLGKNQMSVVGTVLQKAVSPAVLSNCLSTPDSIQSCVDTNDFYFGAPATA